VRSGISIRVAFVALVVPWVVLQSPPAGATGGDLFPRGTGYCASTYPGHPRPFPKEWWGPSVDINRDGGDLNRPVFAPADGKVLVWTTVWRTYHGHRAEGWGNSIVWISADGREQIFVGHLDRVLTRWPQQAVRAGQAIGVSGNTGEVHGTSDGGAHLHVNRMIAWRPAPVVLSGRSIVPSLVPGVRCSSGPHHYVSSGPERARPVCRAPRVRPLTRSSPLTSDPERAWRFMQPKVSCPGPTASAPRP
jgi:hypothetical protein